jgi:hypothetical protein
MTVTVERAVGYSRQLEKQAIDEAFRMALIEAYLGLRDDVGLWDLLNGKGTEPGKGDHMGKARMEVRHIFDQRVVAARMARDIALSCLGGEAA